MCVCVWVYVRSSQEVVSVIAGACVENWPEKHVFRMRRRKWIYRQSDKLDEKREEGCRMGEAGGSQETSRG